jgi:hypothetical protein
MPSAKEPIRAETFRRGRVDLCRQYRPIGIGAVAAALTVTGKREDAVQPAAERGDEQREIEPIAA